MGWRRAALRSSGPRLLTAAARPDAAGYPIPAAQIDMTAEEGRLPWPARMMARVVSLGLEDGQPYVLLERPLTFNVSTGWTPRLALHLPTVSYAGIQGAQLPLLMLVSLLPLLPPLLVSSASVFPASHNGRQPCWRPRLQCTSYPDAVHSAASVGRLHNTCSRAPNPSRCPWLHLQT